MKDLPHHMKKLNSKVIRSARRENLEEELPDIPSWHESEREQKKIAKRAMRAERNKKAPMEKTPEERNIEMKRGRVPIFDRNNAKPKHARSSKKKTPRI